MLESFEEKAKEKLSASALLQVDETSVNINGDRHWLHSASSKSWTYYFPHERRGTVATDAIGILTKFTGILCHDPWKSYYNYEGTYALCNAHHLRELTRAWEQDEQQWAKHIKELLEEINRAVNDSGGVLNSDDSKKYRDRYRLILHNADTECPPP